MNLVDDAVAKVAPRRPAPSSRCAEQALVEVLRPPDASSRSSTGGGPVQARKPPAQRADI